MFMNLLHINLNICPCSDKRTCRFSKSNVALICMNSCLLFWSGLLFEMGCTLEVANSIPTEEVLKQTKNGLAFYESVPIHITLFIQSYLSVADLLNFLYLK